MDVFKGMRYMQDENILKENFVKSKYTESYFWNF